MIGQWRVCLRACFPLTIYQQPLTNEIMNNFFLNDPTLNGSSFDAKIAELQQAQQILEQQKHLYERHMVQQPTNGQPQSQSPVWDEVDALWDGMTDKEREIIASTEEFQESSNHITMILNEQYMAMMRPVVEQSQSGRDALDNHLTLLKRLRKSAQKEADAELDDFKEYKEKYSEMPYVEYQKMKREQSKKGGKK